jgi:transcriptional regulator with PAS, ATPase and Fis domain
MDLSGTLEDASRRALRFIERMKIEDALRDHESRAAAADALGLTQRALANKMKEHGIE